MAERHSRGAIIRNWGRVHDVSVADLGERVGDCGGEQLKKFERGVRDLPLPLLARLAVETGLPLRSLASESQIASADAIAEAVQRCA